MKSRTNWNKPLRSLVERVVYTAGTFDLYHRGHVNLLEQCAMRGDLVVAVLNTDDFIEQYKGRPPVMSYEEREVVLMTNQYVDAVIPNTGGPRCYDTINNHAITHGYGNKYSIVIGDDWASKDYARQMGVPEEQREDFYKKVVFVPYTKDISTTLIKERLKRLL